MGSDLTVKNSYSKTVSHPAKQKGAKVAFDFTKPIHMSGRNSDGGNWSYVFSPDRATLEVCSDTGNYCAIAKDTDKNGKFDTATIHRFDEDLESEEKFDENKPEYDVQTFARNSLTALQQQNSEYKPPKTDIKGKIGHFKQQRTGDCALLASTLALSFTSEGRKIIKDSIKKDKSGDVRIELKGINETYEVSPEEIHDAKWRLSAGSDDMRAIELTLEREKIESAYRRLRLNRMNPEMFDKDYEKYVKKELKDTITGYSATSVFFRLTKSRVDEADGCNWDLKEDPEDPFQPPVWEHSSYCNAEEVQQERQRTQGFLDAKMKYPDKIALSASIIVDKKIPSAHGVGIKKVDKNNVVYVNPWDSSKEITVPREEFMREHFDITFCDLRTRRSKEEDAFAR